MQTINQGNHINPINHGSDIELRSEEFQEVLGAWILRWGITVLAAVVVILLIGSAIVKYPDVIPAQIVLTGSTPPAAIVAHASGKLKELYATDNKDVKTGEYLAVIDNPAETKDIINLKNYLSSAQLSTLNFQLSTFNWVLCSSFSPLSPPRCLNTPNTNDYCITRKKRK